MLPAVQITIVQVEFHPCWAGAAHRFAPQVWMVDLLHFRHDLPVLCPLEGS